jgi:dTDP-3-amino-3,4,6-trideoxy-alpha-D-glucose transaminase
MIVTSSTDIAKRSRLLRNYGQRENYDSEILGDNSRLDELQAAILQIKLKRLDATNRRRREIAGLYREAFKGLQLKMQKETGRSNYHLFVVSTPHRNAVQAHLAANDIPTAVHYPIPLPRQKAFAELHSTRSHCPNADEFCSRVLSLPMHASLAAHQIDRVVTELQAAYARL